MWSNFVSDQMLQYFEILAFSMIIFVNLLFSLSLSLHAVHVLCTSIKQFIIMLKLCCHCDVLTIVTNILYLQTRSVFQYLCAANRVEWWMFVVRTLGDLLTTQNCQGIQYLYLCVYLLFILTILLKDTAVILMALRNLPLFCLFSVPFPS